MTQKKDNTGGLDYLIIYLHVPEIFKIQNVVKVNSFDCFKYVPDLKIR